jgi:hypothetical protein
MQELAQREDSRKAAAVPSSSTENTAAIPAMLMRMAESLWAGCLEKAQGVTAEGFATFEKEFREELMKFGACMAGEAIGSALGTGYQGSRRDCERCGGRLKFYGYEGKTVTTLVREIRLKRAYYRCLKCKRGDVPLDRMLSIEATTFSPGVREAICLLDAEVPFERGSEFLEKLSTIRMHHDEGRRLSEALGSQVDRLQIVEVENVWKPKKPVPRELPDTPDRVYFSPDGTTVHIGEEWNEAKVGTVFTTRTPTSKQEPEREHTRYVATMGDAEDLGKRMYVEALKLGLDEEKSTVIVVADGAHWIWNWAQGSLPKKRVEVIDFYHASEKLWEVKRAVFGEDSSQGVRWAQGWRDRLYEGKVDGCIQALRRLKPRTKEGRECVRKVIGYYQGNRARMRYDEFRRNGYFIGSGVTESSCKRLVGARLKQSGMRWSREGAQAILQLRTTVLNGRWDFLWRGRP